MAETNKATKLDANIDDSQFNNHSEKKKKEDSKLLPYLLGGLILLTAFYFISEDRFSSNTPKELTAEQEQIQTEVTDIVESYVTENGSLPDDPNLLNLPENSEIIMGDGGEWVVSTPDGQLIFSENILPPYEDGPLGEDIQ